MNVYIDTSAFYALIDTKDIQHQAAVARWQDLLGGGDTLITSSFVVTEMVALLHSRFGTETVRRFVDDNLAAVQLLWIDQATHNAALSAMLSTPGKRGPSLTDCASMEVMRQSRTHSIFAYDQHFSDLGLSVLG